MKISEDTSLADMLRIFSEAWPEDARNQCLYREVYERGRSFTAAPLPAEIKRGVIKLCFDNSLRVAEKHGYAYVEGFAISSAITGMPIHHAWNVTPDGKVIDTTWVPAGLEYYGVEIEIDDYTKARDAWVTPLGVMTD